MPFSGRAQSVGYPVFSSYSGSETGLHTISFDTAQDERGVLYFAGAALLTFDGDRWKSVAIPDSYAIRSLNFGPDGRLWVATMGDLGWFEQTPTFEWVFRSLLAKLPNENANIGDVWAVAADKDGATFISSDRILRWNGEHFAIWKKPSEKRLFATRSNGKLFVHRIEDGLFEVDAHGPRLLIPHEILGDAAVVWVEQHNSGWLLGTSDGFFTYEGEKLAPFAPAIDEFLRVGRLSSACRLPDGRIAVGTLKRGLAFLRSDGTLDSFLSDHEGLPSPHITSLFVSRDGELWATTGSHILRIDIRARSKVFDERAGLPHQTYRKITKFRNCVLVGNESGVYEFHATENRFVPVESLLGRWHELRGTSRGLLASGFRTVMVWDGREASAVHQSRFDFFATSTDRSDSEQFLLADYSSVSRLYANGSSRLLVRDLPDTPTSIAEDIDARIWIGTLARGIFVAAPPTDSAVEAPPAADSFGLPKLVGPTHVRTNLAGTLMVFANNGAWQKPAAADHFAPVSNFPIRSIAAVSEMAENGSVWVALENTEIKAPCVGRISLVGSEASWEPHAVDGLLEVGSPRSIYADVVKPDETVLWIGGTHALLRHVVGTNLSAEPPRPPLLRAFARNGADEARAPIRSALRYSTELVEFEFAAPEFSRRSLLRIETRIEGVDPDWTPAGPGSRREMTAIRDGHYTVKARVVAETGVVSKETTFSFDVLPPWWRTAPALVAFALVTAPLVLGAYRLRVRTLRRRNATLEARIRERTEQLERANAAKTQFVANMSHDIRNPLNGIVGLALALEDTRLDGRQREIVSTLRECTTYLSSLVDDVLDFASIEAGRVELRPRVFVPEELLRSIVATLRADTTQSGAMLTVEVGADLPRNLRGDAGRIQQILVNFVSNALKYAGGHIRLSVRVPADSLEEVEFAVTDEGPGIGAAEQATLFTKFSRLRQTRGGEEIPGTGLGLAACRLLADIMGGSVGVMSSVGAGARFFLRLPLTIGVAPVAVPTGHLPNTTVLLVEDTDYNAWAASAVLARLGLTCERARTGADALRLFGEKRFNVVLLDRNLPDMDGTDVARRMREMESDGRQTVLLAVTAYCTAEDRALCLQSGMDAFVGKPLTPEKLRKVLLDASRQHLSAASVHVLAESPVAPARAPVAEPDLALLAYLSDGSAEGIESQIQRFVATLEETESQMTATLLARDFTGLAAAAHQLLCQARMIGSSSLADAASRLEAEACSGDRSGCAERARRTHDEIHRVMEAMHHRRPDAQSV